MTLPRAFAAGPLAVFVASDQMTRDAAPEDYELLSEMGRGGTGVVWRARQRSTGSVVALKTTLDGSRFQRRLLHKEIALSARIGRLGHPGIVRTQGSWTCDGAPWYAMEYIVGTDLGHYVGGWWGAIRDARETASGLGAGTLDLPRESASDVVQSRCTTPGHLLGGHPSWTPNALSEPDSSFPAAAGHLSEAVDLVGSVADTLAALHSQGIVHGDLSPRNVLVRSDGTPVLVDFGTGLLAFAGGFAHEVTQLEGLIVGTPGYMAPEQLRGETLDARSDLYALGCLFYEILTGRMPFPAVSVAALRAQHLHSPVARPSTWVTELPTAIDDLVLALLAKNRIDRVGYADDVISILKPFATRSSKPPAARPLYLYRSRSIGREAMSHALARRLERATQGQGGLLFVAGEGGVGKTRFLNDLCARALAMGMEVAPGSAHDASATGGGVPFGPFRPFLQMLADRCLLPDALSFVAPLASALAVLQDYEPTLSDVDMVRDAHVSPLPSELGLARALRSLAEALRAFATEHELLV